MVFEQARPPLRPGAGSSKPRAGLILLAVSAGCALALLGGGGGFASKQASKQSFTKDFHQSFKNRHLVEGIVVGRPEAAEVNGEVDRVIADIDARQGAATASFEDAIKVGKSCQFVMISLSLNCDQQQTPYM